MSQAMIFGRGRAPEPAVVTDPYFANVAFLSGFEGVDGATAFTDESLAAHALTAVGNAQVDTAQFKFGNSAYLGDGAGDCITSPDHADWTPAGDFTWEGWWRPASVAATQCFVSHYENTTNQRGYFLNFVTGGTGLRFFATSDGVGGAGANVDFSAAWAPSTNTWYFISVSRVGNSWVSHVDGVVKGTATSSLTIFNSNQVLRLGAVNSSGIVQSVNGHMDDWRYTKGVGRYTNTNYTPPTAAFPRG